MTRISDYLDSSISSATLKNEDLLKAFTSILEDLSSPNPSQTEIKTINDCTLYIKAYEKKEFVNEEDVSYLINDELLDLLNDYCPEGYYFGTHIGDSADFGFWKIEKEN